MSRAKLADGEQHPATYQWEYSLPEAQKVIKKRQAEKPAADWFCGMVIRLPSLDTHHSVAKCRQSGVARSSIACRVQFNLVALLRERDSAPYE